MDVEVGEHVVALLGLGEEGEIQGAIGTHVNQAIEAGDVFDETRLGVG